MIVAEEFTKAVDPKGHQLNFEVSIKMLLPHQI